VTLSDLAPPCWHGSAEIGAIRRTCRLLHRNDFLQIAGKFPQIHDASLAVPSTCPLGLIREMRAGLRILIDALRAAQVANLPAEGHV